MTFSDRHDAGRQLVKELTEYKIGRKVRRLIGTPIIYAVSHGIAKYS